MAMVELYVRNTDTDHRFNKIYSNNQKDGR